MNLYEIMLKNVGETDKYDLGYIDHVYSDLFLNIKNPINLLEIGINLGGSIKLWKNYFHNLSNIYGMDINYCKNLENEERVIQIIGDAYSKEKANFFENNYLDIIIDDGPHTLESFISLIDIYFDKLKNNGILVIEDIVDTNWTQTLIDQGIKKGFKSYTKYDMRMKQKIKSLEERWKNGLDLLVFNK